MVTNDVRVTEMEEKYLDAMEAVKIREAEMKHVALTTRLEAREKALLEVQEPSVIHKRLYELQDQLAEAEEKLDLATAEVEVQRATLEVYRMLVKLEETSQLRMTPIS